MCLIPCSDSNHWGFLGFLGKAYPTLPWSFGVLLSKGLEPPVQNLTCVLNRRITVTPVINKYFSDAEGKQGGAAYLHCHAVGVSAKGGGTQGVVRNRVGARFTDVDLRGRNVKLPTRHLLGKRFLSSFSYLASFLSHLKYNFSFFYLFHNFPYWWQCASYFCIF